MTKRGAVPAMALIAVLMFLPLTRAQQLNRQPGAVYDADFIGQTSGPAPRRSLSGIWEFAQGRNVAVQADGAKAMPSDGKPEHELPFTPEGRAAFMANKPTFGITQVPSALTNDPMPGCDPQGFPRIVLHNAHTEITIDDPKFYTRPWVAPRQDSFQAAITQFGDSRAGVRTLGNGEI